MTLRDDPQGRPLEVNSGVARRAAASRINLTSGLTTFSLPFPRALSSSIPPRAAPMLVLLSPTPLLPRGPGELPIHSGPGELPIHSPSSRQSTPLQSRLCPCRLSHPPPPRAPTALRVPLTHLKVILTLKKGRAHLCLDPTLLRKCVRSEGRKAGSPLPARPGPDPASAREERGVKTQALLSFLSLM